MSETPHRVVIVGGGFGGLHAAQRLKRAPVQVTLVDRRNFHLFQPLLYQVATGGLSPANIAAPLRAILRRQKNCEVLLGEVVDFDAQRREVVLTEGRLPYDTLVIAAGSSHSYFGHDNWSKSAPGLKTIEDATAIRAHVLSAFEEAELTTDPERRRALLTFAIVGGGPTGVELAGALSELARYTLKHDFRNINPADARILLFEAGPRILPPYPERLSRKAEHSLARLSVTVRDGTMVTDVGPGRVTVKCDDREETIAAETVLWAAGVQASPLAARLAAATGAKTDRPGHIIVEPDLSLADHPEILVIGDMANCTGRDGKPLPGIAPVAIQQGRYVAKLIRARLGGKPIKPFRYWHLGDLATIGRSAAVARVFGLQFSGYIAWLLWLFVHLMKIVQFQNRVLVFVQWAWSYLTHARGARLITEVRPARPEEPNGHP
jgi:NADH dehydrogenase